MWKKEVGNGSEGLTAIQVDPIDRRTLCLCGTKGSLNVLKLVNPFKDRHVICPALIARVLVLQYGSLFSCDGVLPDGKRVSSAIIHKYHLIHFASTL